MNDEHFVEFNDYVNLVRFHLKNYRRYTATISYLMRNIQRYEDILDESRAAAPIARYSDMPGGGTPELNSIEQTVEDTMDARDELSLMKRGLVDVESHLQSLAEAASHLEPIDRDILVARYKHGYGWEQVGYQVGLSASRSRHRANAAIKELAIIIFGPKAAMPPRQLFLFAF